MTTPALSTRLLLCAAAIGLCVGCGRRHQGTPVIARSNMPATEVCASAGVDPGSCPNDVVVSHADVLEPADEADLAVARRAVALVLGALQACEVSPAPETSFVATLASGLEPIVIATINGKQGENGCLRSHLTGLAPRADLVLAVGLRHAN